MRKTTDKGLMNMITANEASEYTCYMPNLNIDGRCIECAYKEIAKCSYNGWKKKKRKRKTLLETIDSGKPNEDDESEDNEIS